MNTKLNLNYGDDIRENGYLNVGKKPRDLLPEIYRQGDIQLLDWICEDNSLEEILALDIMQHIPPNKIQEALQNWSRKLSSNGVLKISILDIYHVSKMFVDGQLSISDFISQIFGRQDDESHVSGIDADTLCQLLRACGLSIMQKRYDGLKFYIEAIKSNDSD